MNHHTLSYYQKKERKDMKIEVDYDRCQSNAVCMQIAPNVFEVREDGYLYVLIDAPEEPLRPLIEKAVASCPTQAIKII